MNENQDNISIRRMVEGDLALVNDVDNSISGKGRVTSWPFSFDIYWNLYSPSIIVYVAELNGQVTGFISGYIQQEERSKSLVMLPRETGDIKQDKKIGWIEMMGVRPTAWHKGIGTRLINAFQDECKKNDATMRIILKGDDADLRRYFQEIGFRAPEFITLEKNS